MKTYILISIGGIFGAISRYFIKGINIDYYSGNLPINTLIINVLGSLVLAIVLTIAFEIWKFDESVRFGIASGFLGSFTTFSALTKETANILKEGLYFSAISYIILSIILGLAAIYLGIVIARKLFGKLLKVNATEAD
ncbi:MAG: fluoride efflux transporter CrcB [Vulcanibacillus sp.]